MTPSERVEKRALFASRLRNGILALSQRSDAWEQLPVFVPDGLERDLPTLRQVVEATKFPPDVDLSAEDGRFLFRRREGWAVLLVKVP